MTYSPIIESINRTNRMIERVTHSPFLENINRTNLLIERMTANPILDSVNQTNQMIERVTHSPFLESIDRTNLLIERMTESPIFESINRTNRMLERVTQSQFIGIDYTNQFINRFTSGYPLAEDINVFQKTLIRSVNSFTPQQAESFSQGIYQIATESNIEIPTELEEENKVKNVISSDELKSFCYKLSISTLVVAVSMGWETDEILTLLDRIWKFLGDLSPLANIITIGTILKKDKSKN